MPLRSYFAAGDMIVGIGPIDADALQALLDICVAAGMGGVAQPIKGHRRAVGCTDRQPESCYRRNNVMLP
jgi:hypothetical protein